MQRARALPPADPSPTQASTLAVTMGLSLIHAEPVSVPAACCPPPLPGARSTVSMACLRVDRLAH